MSPPRPLGLLAGILGGLAAACGGGGDEPDLAALSGRPCNVVVFLVDALRADHLGCYGYGRDTSPEIDAFAREAVLFERCLAQSSWTKPATASLLTGLYPSRHSANQAVSVLDGSIVTLAELLAERGWRTGAFGYNPHVFRAGSGFEQGFEIFRQMTSEGGDYPFPRAAKLVDAALEWLEGLGDERFFLYLHVMDPHAPYAPPPPFDARFDDGYAGDKDGHFGLRDPGEGPEDLTPADWQHLRDLYDGEIAYVDREFGRLLRRLDAAGRAEDTLVVLVADHGEEFGDHGDWRHNPWMYDELVHVPLVCRFPGSPDSLRGKRVAELALQVDLLPTVAGLVGAPPPDGVSGASLLAKALDPALVRDHHGISETSSPAVYRKAVVKDGKKYIRTWSPEPGEALFDLERDPLEREDLAAERPDDLRELSRLLDAHVRTSTGRYSLTIENATGETVRTTGYLYTEHARVDGQLIDFELVESGVEDGDGPYLFESHEVEGRPRFVLRFTLRTAPGDRDGLVFRPHALETQVGLALAVGGETPEPAWFAIGPEGLRAVEVPLELDLTRPELYLSPGPPPPPDDAAPYRISIWKNIDAASPTAELSPEELEALRAIGYVDDH